MEIVMAGKSWDPGQAGKFCRQLKLGHSYWVVLKMATNVAPYEDPETCREFVFTKRLWGTGNPCTADGYSAHTVCQNFGPVYEDKPRGVRNIAGPAPQVSAPLGGNYEGILDEAEIRGLEKQVRQGSNPRTRRPASWRF